MSLLIEHMDMLIECICVRRATFAIYLSCLDAGVDYSILVLFIGQRIAILVLIMLCPGLCSLCAL